MSSPKQNGSSYFLCKIYVIMTSFRTLSQGPFSINYVGSNHLIYCTVEGNSNTLVSWASYEDRAGNGNRHR